MKSWADITGNKIEKWYKNCLEESTDGGESFKILYNRITSF